MPLALALAAPGAAGRRDRTSPSDKAAGTPADQVKTDGFEDLGPVTLKVISSEGSGGPRDALKALSKSFEEKYPNVTVKISFRDFAAWTKQAKLVASSDNPPDVFGGNQGYQLDGELVKAGLILPLTEYAKAYGWDESYSPETLQQFEWTDDGQKFGEGTLWGVAQTGQSVGVFASKKKLDAAGVDPASLKTFDEFDAALAKLRDSLPADEPVIALGNKDQYAAMHLWGGIQGAYTPAQDVRDWIFQKDGATFDTRGQPHVAGEAQGVVGQGLLRQARPVQLAQRLGRGDRVRQGRGRPDDRWQLERGDREGRARRRRHVLQHAARRERRQGRDRLDELPDAHLGQDEAAGPRRGVPRLDHRAGRRPGAGRHPAGAGGDRRHRRAERPARQGGQGPVGTSSSRTAA